MGEFISFGAGGLLMIVSALVMLAYWPRGQWWQTGSGLLGFAIFASFASDLANTTWWQILGNTISGPEALVSREAFRAVGLYLDGIFKGSAVLAGILHLVAIHRNLPEEERGAWRWYQMPWYPKRRACLELIANVALWKRNGK